MKRIIFIIYLFVFNFGIAQEYGFIEKYIVTDSDCLPIITSTDFNVSVGTMDDPILLDPGFAEGEYINLIRINNSTFSTVELDLTSDVVTNCSADCDNDITYSYNINHNDFDNGYEYGYGYATDPDYTSVIINTCGFEYHIYTLHLQSPSDTTLSNISESDQITIPGYGWDWQYQLNSGDWTDIPDLDATRVATITPIDLPNWPGNVNSGQLRFRTGYNGEWLENNVIIYDLFYKAPEIESWQAIAPLCANGLGSLEMVFPEDYSNLSNGWTFKVNLIDDTASSSSNSLTIYPGNNIYSIGGGNYQLTVDNVLTPGTNYYVQCYFTKDVNGTPLNSDIEETNIFQVTAPTQVYFTTSQTHPQCHGDNGNIIITDISGGTEEYEYSLDGGNTWIQIPVNASFPYSIPKPAGTYTIRVNDSNGCPNNSAPPINNEVSITINDQPAITADVSTTEVTCFGGNDGTITVNNIAGGNTPNQYKINNGSYQAFSGTSFTETGLTAGTYTVYIKDANECVQSFSNITVSEPDNPITYTITDITDASCFGENGLFTLTASGGWNSATYKYKIVDANDVSNVIVDWVNFSSPTQISIGAGDYQVLVKNSLECQGSNTGSGLLTVTEPTLVTFEVEKINDVLCHGDQSGKFKITASGGGTGTYKYTINNGITWSELTANPLEIYVVSGNYTVRVKKESATSSCVGIYKDENGHLTHDDFYHLEITEPQPISFTNVQVTDTGYQLSNGSITVDILGASPPYNNIYWNKDGALFTPTSITDIRDSSDVNVIIGAHVEIEGLNAGIYTLSLSDAHGCSYTKTDDILNEIPELVIDAIEQTQQIQCYGESTAELTATVSGGLPYSPPRASYNYVWNRIENGTPTNDNFDNSNVISNLAAGFYRLTVTDSISNRATSTDVEIAQNQPLNISETHTNVNCYGANTGSITLIITGGTSTYSYLWDSGQTTKDISDLVAGTYVVTVTDTNGCTATQSISVTEVNQINFANVITTDPTGSGLSNGTISVDISGGTMPYRDLIWTDSNAVNHTPTSITDSGSFVTVYIDGLPEGIYNLSFTDANDCIYSKASDTLQDPLPLTVSLNITNVSCFGGNNGNLQATANGGVGSYSYEWKKYNTTTSTWETINGETNASLDNQYVGNYKVIVTDENGITTEATAEIDEHTQIYFTATKIQDVQCNGDSSGQIEISASGGTLNGVSAGTFQYSTDNGSTWTNFTSNPITINKPAATYTIKVQKIIDSNACAGVVESNGDDTIEIEITEPSLIEFSAENINDVTCFGEQDGTIRITASGGESSATYKYRLNSGEPWTDFTSNPMDINVDAGNYQIEVQNSIGCVGYEYGDVNTIISVDVSQPTQVTFTVEKIQDVQCYQGTDGQIRISASNGAINSYKYSIDNGLSWNDLTSNPMLIDLPAGNYQIKVNNSIDCEGVTVNDNSMVVNSIDIDITEPSQIYFTATLVQDVTCYDGNNGAIEISASGGETTDYQYSTDNGTTWHDFDGNTVTVNGLIAGDYQVRVRKNEACFGVEQTTNNNVVSITVLQPSTPITANMSSVNVSCFGENSGEIFIANISGGTPEIDAQTNNSIYHYSVNNGAVVETVNNSITLQNLSSGTYDIHITDSEDCSLDYSIIITQPVAPLTASESHTIIDCYGGSSGEIVFTNISGGTPGVSTITGNQVYYYNVNGGDFIEIENNSFTLSNLSSDIYDINIKDAVGCIINYNISITQRDELIATLTANKVSCNGYQDGSVYAQVSGGEAPYTFLWNTGATTQNLLNQYAGTYSVNITDANGCTTQGSVEITQPDAIQITYTYTEPLGANTSDGSITATVTGGTPFTDGSYEYVWEDSNNSDLVTQTVTQINANNYIITLSNIRAGTYHLTITDNFNCSLFSSTTLTAPDLLVVSLNATDVSCNGLNDGELQATVQGGITPYSYVWKKYDGAIWQTISGETDASISNLLPGDYKVIATDANGITAEMEQEIVEPQPLLLTYTKQDVTCSGNGDGRIEGTVSGGTSGYQYQIRNDGVWHNITSNSFTIDNIYAGRLTIIIKDAHNCEIYESVDIYQPLPLAVSFDIYSPSAVGSQDGYIHTAVSGGTPPYTYQWDLANSPYSTNEDIDNLVAGDYELTVTDSAGCTYSQSISLSVNLTVSVSETQSIRCFGGVGELSASVYGSQAPYTYQWFKVENGTDIDLNISTEIASNLIAGDYKVKVTSNTGVEESANYTLSQPDELFVSSTKNDVTCFNGNNGSITVTVQGGTGVLKYKVNAESSWHVFSGNSFVVNDLSAGACHIEIKDANNCTQSIDENITQPTNLTVQETISNPTANGRTDGSINIDVSGANPPYTFDWVDDNANHYNTEDIDNIGAGNYTLVITDQNACNYSYSFTLIEYDALTISIVEQQSINCFGEEGELQANVTGELQPYTYQWYRIENGNEINLSINTDIISNIPAGDYRVRISTANGVQAFADYTLIQPPEIVITQTKQDVSCFGGSDGSIDASISGGTGALYTQWFDANGTVISNQEDVNNLTQGIYTLLVTDSQNCTNSVSVNIQQPPEITLISQQVVQATQGQNNGSITVVLTGGTDISQGTYQWHDQNGDLLTDTSSSGTNSAYEIVLNNLGAGTYTLTVQDVNNCAKVFPSITINDIWGHITLQQIDNCAGSTLKAETNGTMLSPTYAWFKNQGGTFVALPNTSNEISGQTAGEFKVEISFNNGLIVSDTYTLLSPDITDFFDVIDTTNEISCNNACDGEIALNITGGLAPYTILWNDGSTATDRTALCDGTYSYTVTDQYGCAKTNSITLVNPPLLTVDLGADVVLCAGETVTYDVAVSDPNATYNWQGDNGFTSNLSEVILYDAGVYTVTITNGNGCTATDSVTITQSTTTTVTSFLLTSQAFTNEDVILINTSQPLDNNVSWIVPPNVQIIEENYEFIKLRFASIGSYEIKLRYFYNNCHVDFAKSIVVSESDNIPNPDNYESIVSNFNLYPNPNSGNFTINVDLIITADVSLKLFSLVSGAPVDIKNMSGSNTYTQNYNLTLTPGVYFMLLETQAERQLLKIIVQ